MRPLSLAVMTAVLAIGCVGEPRSRPRTVRRTVSETIGRDLIARAEAIVSRLESGEAAPEHCEYAAASLGGLAAAVPPRAAEAEYLHARVLHACGRADDAERALRRALALSPSNVPALAMAARFARYEGRLDEADRLARRALSIEPSSVDGALELSAVLRERTGTQSLAEAERLLLVALRSSTDRADVHNALAAVYLAQAAWSPQRLELATAACRRGADADPSFGPIHTTWGQVELRKGNATRAGARFQMAMDLDRRALEPRLAFGSLSVALGAYEEARGALEEAIRIAGPRPVRRGLAYDANVYLAVAFRGLERDPEARSVLQRARDIDPERPEAYFHLGQIAAGSGSPAEARENLQSFLERAGDPEARSGALDEARRLLGQVSP